MSFVRNLVFVLGDQLDFHSAAFDGFDPQQDVVLMAEVTAESQYAWSHKVRIAFFLSAMRHFAAQLRARKYQLEYRKLEASDNGGTLERELLRGISKFRPKRLVVVEPGEYRVQEMINSVAAQARLQLDLLPDRHFYCSRKEFAQWAKGRKQLRLEFFYREMRKKHSILMEKDQPAGNQWNFDTDNRGSFGKPGPKAVPAPHGFPPDELTQEVLHLVNTRFAEHPGSLDHFDFPVTPRQAQTALRDFISHRLPVFGKYQDAMWTNQPVLYHSRISAAMNVKLLNPRDVIAAAQEAYDHKQAPLPAVEGFIRQILGWREYVRGIYWTFMPEYGESNSFAATEKLPAFYWTANTDMNCLKQAIGQTLEYGYAHHIQRLMVTGLFALLYGANPFEVHMWYLAVYVDAVEWVELPNTIGMSQAADGGVMASKPYVATGKYIARMSNYCKGCRYRPAEATGSDACPFTTLYWDFLMRHETLLKHSARMEFQLRNLIRLSDSDKVQIRERSASIRAGKVGIPLQPDLDN